MNIMSERPKRLTSFKGRRDLTLGASSSSSGGGQSSAATQKKQFVPNLNVQRNNKKDEKSKAKSSSSSLSSGNQWKKPASKNHGNNKRQQNLIQIGDGSVFADGINASSLKKQSGGGRASIGGNSESEVNTVKQKLALVKRDKDEEEKRLNALLRDDFIDDGDLGTGQLVPVQLPMALTGKVFKEEAEAETVKSEKKKKRINRILDSDSEDEQADVSKTIHHKNKDDVNLELTDLLRKPSESGSGSDVFLFQLPDHLPASDAPPAVEVKPDPDGEPPPAAETEMNPEEDGKSSFSSLPEGFIGRVVVRKSGRVQMRIGEDLFDLDTGTQVGFLQELVSIDRGESGSVVGNLTVLGQIKHRVVVTPDWEQLFRANDEEGSEGENGFDS